MGFRFAPCADCGCGECLIYEDETPAGDEESGVGGVPSNALLEVNVRVVVTLADGETARIVLAKQDASNYWYAEFEVGATPSFKIFERVGGSDTEREPDNGACDPTDIPAGEWTFCAAVYDGTFTAAISGGGPGYQISYTPADPADFLGTGWVIDVEGSAADLDVQKSSCRRCGESSGEPCDIGVLPPDMPLPDSDFEPVRLSDYPLVVDFGAGGWVDEGSDQCDQLTGEYKLITGWVDISETGSGFGVLCLSGFYVCRLEEFGAPTDLIIKAHFSQLFDGRYYASVQVVIHTGEAGSWVTYSTSIPECARWDIDDGNVVTLTKIGDFHQKNSLALEYACSGTMPETITIRLSQSPDEPTEGEGCEDTVDPPTPRCVTLQYCGCDDTVQAWIYNYISSDELEVGDIVRVTSSLNVAEGCYTILSFDDDEDCPPYMLGFSVVSIIEFLESCDDCIPAECDCCESDGEPTRLPGAILSIGAFTSSDPDLQDEADTYVTGTHSIDNNTEPTSGGCAEGTKTQNVSEDPGRTIVLRWRCEDNGDGTCHWDCHADASGGTRGTWSITWEMDEPKTTACDGNTIGHPDGIPQSGDGPAGFDTFPSFVDLVPVSLCGTDE